MIVALKVAYEAYEVFLFYLNHDELVYFSSLAKIQRLTYVCVIFGEKENNLINTVVA